MGRYINTTACGGSFLRTHIQNTPRSYDISIVTGLHLGFRLVI
jgi:hypothetical protein